MKQPNESHMKLLRERRIAAVATINPLCANGREGPASIDVAGWTIKRGMSEEAIIDLEDCWPGYSSWNDSTCAAGDSSC